MHHIFLLDDMLMVILSYLGKDELMNTSFVNKGMHKLTHGNPLWSFWLTKNVPMRVDDKLIMPRTSSGSFLGSSRHYASLCAPRDWDVLILWKVDLSRITVIDMPGLSHACCLGREYEKTIYCLRRGSIYMRRVSEAHTELKCHMGIYDTHIRKIIISDTGRAGTSNILFLTNSGTFHTIDLDGGGKPVVGSTYTPILPEMDTGVGMVDISTVQTSFRGFPIVYALMSNGVVLVQSARKKPFLLLGDAKHRSVCLVNDKFVGASGDVSRLCDLGVGKEPRWSFNGEKAKTLHEFLSDGNYGGPRRSRTGKSWLSGQRNITGPQPLEQERANCMRELAHECRKIRPGRGSAPIRASIVPDTGTVSLFPIQTKSPGEERVSQGACILFPLWVELRREEKVVLHSKGNTHPLRSLSNEQDSAGYQSQSTGAKVS